MRRVLFFSAWSSTQPRSDRVDRYPRGKSASLVKKPFTVKSSLVLAVTPLLAILFASFHLVDDIVFGSDKSVASNLIMVAVLAVWLYGTLMLSERRSGHIIILIGSVLGLLIFAVHVSGAGGLPGMKIGNLSGAFFFVWTLLALAVVSFVSFAMSARGLWALLRSKAG